MTPRKLSKTDRAALYTELVLGHLLVTLREAFAVAPGSLRPVWWCFKTLVWLRSRIVQDAASELLVNRRIGKGLQPIDLRQEPGIQALISVVDVEELLT